MEVSSFSILPWQLEIPAILRIDRVPLMLFNFTKNKNNTNINGNNCKVRLLALL
jgi:hypothetical protein